MHKIAYTVAVLAIALASAQANDRVAQECISGSEFDRQIRACSFLAERAELDRDKSAAFYNRGLLYEGQGQREKARADFGASLAVDPTFAPSYAALGQLFELDGEFSQALSHFDEALRLEPSALLFVRRGRVLEVLGHFDLAIADFKRALELDPDLLPAHDGLGRAYGIKGEFPSAVAAFGEALTRNPDYAPSYYNRAVVLHVQGEKARAAQDLTTALRLNPDLRRSLPKDLASLVQQQKAEPRGKTSRR